jgi:hypothetical protein
MNRRSSKNQLHEIIENWIETASESNLENHVFHFTVLKKVLKFDSAPEGQEFNNAFDFLKTKCKESEKRKILIEALENIKGAWIAQMKSESFATDPAQADLF